MAIWDIQWWTEGVGFNQIFYVRYILVIMDSNISTILIFLG